jgi:hypothetical protein
LSVDPADDALNFEQLSRCSEKWLVVGIEAKDAVAKMFADVEEISGATAKIENPQWRRTIEPEILRTFDVDLDPINNVLETIDLW